MAPIDRPAGETFAWPKVIEICSSPYCLNFLLPPYCTAPSVTRCSLKQRGGYWLQGDGSELGNFFNNKKWFFAFFVKLIWLGVGFLNRAGSEIGNRNLIKNAKNHFYYWKNLKIPKVPSSGGGRDGGWCWLLVETFADVLIRQDTKSEWRARISVIRVNQFWRINIISTVMAVRISFSWRPNFSAIIFTYCAWAI